MPQLKRLLPLILALFLCAQASAQRVTSRAEAQQQLDRKAWSNGIAAGQAPEGGSVEFAEGEILIDKPIILRPGAIVRGQGDGTLLKKAPGYTEAIFIMATPGDHGAGDNCLIENLATDGPGPVFRYAQPWDKLPKLYAITGEFHRPTFRNLTIHRGSIDLWLPNSSHVTYQPTFDNIYFRSPDSWVLRGAVRMATLRNVKVLGKWKGGLVPAGMIDFWGLASGGELNNCHIEGDYPCPFLKFTGGSEGYEALWRIKGLWSEPNWEALNSHPQMVLSGTRLEVDRMVAQDLAPIILKDRSELNASLGLRATDEAGRVIPLGAVYKTDLTSSVYLNGVKQAIAPQQ